MADFDTKVLFLENPPVEAPPASYIIGVRMKNLGIEPAATSGFVQVFLKSTGELVKTFNVASATMDPDEEKQAFATQALDLTEAEPGEQYIFSGDITSPGDTVRSNDILNPTIITIVDEPPPPPPPVASHASQHEDGGSDELDLTGLKGELGTPQPFAPHAVKHQDEGDDEINVNGLSGQLDETQIPSEHGNERHVETYATTTLLTNHENDETPHDAATSLEKTAEKGQVDGYAGLDGAGVVPDAQLPATLEHTTNKAQVNGYAGLDGAAMVPHAQLGTGGGTSTGFLRDDSTYQVISVPALGTPIRLQLGEAASDGVSTDTARADHQHSQQGPLDCECEINNLNQNPVPYVLLNKVIDPGWCPSSLDVMVYADIYGECHRVNPADTMKLDLRYGDSPLGTFPVRASCAFTFDHPHDLLTWHVRLVCMKKSIFTFTGRAHGTLVDPGGGPTHGPVMPAALLTPVFDTGLPSQIFVEMTLVGNALLFARYITTRTGAQFDTSGL